MFIASALRRFLGKSKKDMIMAGSHWENQLFLIFSTK